MKATLTFGLCLAWAAAPAFSGDATVDQAKLFSPLRTYVEQRAGEFSKIPDERQAQLRKLALYVRTRNKAGQPARLTFICTHNSRRSHMSQIWASVAAGYYGVQGVETYSGGTEATAFNPRAVAAMERAGLKIVKQDEAKDARYAVRFTDGGEPLVCFSKVYSESPNPREDFCAVMTCTQADKNCPVVQGASLRIPLPFDDPKVADDTPAETAKYDERCQQIGREMLFLFSQVNR